MDSDLRKDVAYGCFAEIHVVNWRTVGPFFNFQAFTILDSFRRLAAVANSAKLKFVEKDDDD